MIDISIDLGIYPCALKTGKASLACLVVAWFLLMPVQAKASALYTYDQLGRLSTVLYDNGLCLAYVYDANGNRTAINSVTNAPVALTWGSGTWGCSRSTAQ